MEESDASPKAFGDAVRSSSPRNKTKTESKGSPSPKKRKTKLGREEIIEEARRREQMHKLQQMEKQYVYSFRQAKMLMQKHEAEPLERKHIKKVCNGYLQVL